MSHVHLPELRQLIRKRLLEKQKQILSHNELNDNETYSVKPGSGQSVISVNSSLWTEGWTTSTR